MHVGIAPRYCYVEIETMDGSERMTLKHLSGIQFIKISHESSVEGEEMRGRQIVREEEREKRRDRQERLEVAV